MRQTTFVLLTTQRSGSGWLVDLLDDHPSMDLLARRDDVLGALSDFLGVPAPPRTLRSKVVPTVPGRTVDLVQNRDAVRAALAGTEYEWLAA